MPKAPSLRRRRLAAELRRLREQAGYEIGQAAEASGVHRSTLSRIESASRAASGDDTYALATLYGLGEGEAIELVRLARQSNRQGWWHVYPNTVVGDLADRVELQEDAHDTRQFTIDVIPGLLQSEAYAAAVISSGVRDLDDDTVTERVKVRTELGNRALDNDSDLWFVVDEAALARPVGGHAVMAEQLDTIARLSRRKRVKLQVLPSDVTAHAALALPFLLVTLHDGYTYACVEMLTSTAYIDEDSDVCLYRRAWELLQATALDFRRSTEVVMSYAEQHRSKTNESPPATIPGTDLA